MRRVLSGFRRFADNDLVHDIAAFAAMAAFLSLVVLCTTEIATTVSAWRVAQ